MAYFGGSVSQRPWSRFDARFMLLLMLCVAGLVAAVWMLRESLAKQLLQRQQPVEQLSQSAVPENNIAPVQHKTTEVLVAVNPIPAGTRLRPAMFRLETKIADDSLAQNVLLNLNQIEGAYSRISIAAGAPLLKDGINVMATSADITEKIPPGYRAVAIPVNKVSGVEGWVQPGARVDVVWTTDNKGKLITTTLVENAQVLSAERRLEEMAQDNDPDAPVPSHVTLLVTTKESQRLQLAKNSGSLSLSLRGDRDAESGNTATLSTDSIIKNHAQSGPEDVQGKVSFGGQDYILSGAELIPSGQYQARAKMKEANDF